MPLRDAKHLKFIRLLFCVKCGTSSNIEASHIRKFGDGGTGMKPSDDRVLSLCRDCHALSHKGGVTFWGGVDGVYKAIDWAKELYAVTGDIFKGQRVVIKARKDLM